MAIAIGEFKSSYGLQKRRRFIIFFQRPLMFYVICLLHINCMYVDLVFFVVFVVFWGYMSKSCIGQISLAKQN